MYKARLPGLRSAPPLALGWELEPQGTFKMVTCLVLLKQIVIVKKINKENYKYPLISREKKKEVLVPNYAVADKYFKALSFSFFVNGVFLVFGS